MDNTNRYCSVEQSIIESFKQITEIRSQKIKKKTWDELVSEEEEGDIIPNLKLEENACTYKVRAANINANVGKSNGYRMLYYVIKDDSEIYLLTIYSKKDGERISNNNEIVDMVNKFVINGGK